jgi:hypothetical protein
LGVRHERFNPDADALVLVLRGQHVGPVGRYRVAKRDVGLDEG